MNKPGQKAAMISSTAVDLPDHRRQVIDACLREDIFPIAMEYIPSRDADAIRVSLEMVNRADIYIGILAWRYGHTPDGHDISITEMEFNHAVKRQIPILIFLAHKSHQITIEMVEANERAQQKLSEFKKRAGKVRIRREFKSPEDLRYEVLHALSDLKQCEQRNSLKASPNFHPLNIIPKLPEPYIAHPYSLLQTKDIVGRQNELDLLTDWVTTNKQVPIDTRIFSFVAIGGMGKSAVTWKWFNDVVPNVLPRLAGRMWWSFYESDAHWENFIIRTLIYVSGQSEQAVREMTLSAREDQLCYTLDQQPFLLVLDGLERILLAYARIDAAQMLDDDLDERTSNCVAEAQGLPESAGESFVGKHHLRCTTDHRAGQFLRRLAQVKQSRILITSRLYPAELQTDTGNSLPRCFASFLMGLRDDDALNLWREFKVRGSKKQLLPIFNSFSNYPLLIRALAGEVSSYREAPGDFDAWLREHPKFNPVSLPLKNAKSHVLEFALHGLNEKECRVLHAIAAFRMPATWETLKSLFVEREVGTEKNDLSPSTSIAPSFKNKLFPENSEMDRILIRLEDRGLLGWNRQSNRYDLHPIVRSVVWNTLDRTSRERVLHEFYSYFDAIPQVENWRNIERLEDLTPALELYNTLIGLEQFDKACEVFFERLDSVTDYRLCASRLRIELLTPLIEITKDGDPRVSQPASLKDALHALGRAWLFAGYPNEAAEFLDAGVSLSEQSPLLSGPDCGCLADLSGAFRVGGHLFEAELAALKALEKARERHDTFQEGSISVSLGLVLAARGCVVDSDVLLKRAINIARMRKHVQFEGFVASARAQRDLWFSNAPAAFANANQALKFAQRYLYERDFIRTARLLGSAALETGEISLAMEHLHQSLYRARQVDFIEEEIRSLVGLAECHRQKKDFLIGRDLLDQIWTPAERGPYPLFHADALNVLTCIQRDEGENISAIAAATKAYTLAWCDGPPYAYSHGLVKAQKYLLKHGAELPLLPIFDKSKFEKMPNVELNPKDEFWINLRDS